MIQNRGVSDDYRTIQQIVTENIRNAILDVTLKPGDRLNQADLAEKLNVSRIPTREALRTLAAEGLVTFYPRRGAVVSAMTAEEIEEVYEIRILLETSAAVRSLRLMDSTQLQMIQDIHNRLLKVTDSELWIKLNTEFHHATYAPSGWTRLLSVVDMMRNLTAPYLRLYVSERSEREAALEEHSEIIKAIEDKNSTSLKSIIRRHLTRSCQGVVAHLKS